MLPTSAGGQEEEEEEDLVALFNVEQDPFEVCGPLEGWMIRMLVLPALVVPAGRPSSPSSSCSSHHSS